MTKSSDKFPVKGTPSPSHFVSHGSRSSETGSDVSLPIQGSCGAIRIMRDPDGDLKLTHPIHKSIQHQHSLSRGALVEEIDDRGWKQKCLTWWKWNSHVSLWIRGICLSHARRGGRISRYLLQRLKIVCFNQLHACLELYRNMLSYSIILRSHDLFGCWLFRVQHIATRQCGWCLCKNHNKSEERLLNAYPICNAQSGPWWLCA